MSISFRGTNFRDDISKITEFREINLTPNFFRERDRDRETERQRQRDREKQTETERLKKAERQR